MPPRSVTRSTPLPGRPQLTVSEQKRLLALRASEYALKSVFKYGYRNKEDPSNLPPNTMVIGSQNVLTNAAELVGTRQGYVLDGPAGTQNDFGIDSKYDFPVRTGTVRNLRKWGTNLECRYVNPVTSTVAWINILPTLNSGNVCNFTPFWDQNTELKEECLFVNGDNKVYVWSGGVGSYASSTAPVAGTVATAAVNNAGSGYVVGDILTLTSGGTGGTVRVNSVAVGGGINGLQIVTVGNGYSAGSSNTSGGTGSAATVTLTVQSAGTLTVSGTLTLDQLNFLSAAGNVSLFNIIINGVTYNYKAVSGQTFLGVTPDASIAGINVGDAVLMKPSNIVGANMTGLNSATYNFDLIDTLDNQVWYASFTRNDLYVSKTNTFTDVSFSPTRLPAEGAQIILDAPPVALKSEGEQMYASAGTDQWWLSNKNQQTIEVNTVAVSTETLFMQRLKTTYNQGAKSQALVAHFKNTLIYVSNEVIVNSLGLVQNIYTEPQFVNLSDPIKFDVDAYDFTGGAVDQEDYYIYVTVPKEGVIRLYNVQKNYWEAPQTIPVSRFYRVVTNNKVNLYGHSSLTNESYQLNTGYNDNGNPINVVAAFPYVSTEGGSANMKKNFNKVYVEGYLASNTILMMTINYDFGGFSGSYTTLMDGSDLTIIFNKITDGSLGQNSLGSQPIGSILNLANAPSIPKFRQISTMPRVDFFDYQIVFSSNDVDQNWTLLRFGPAIGGSQAVPVSITK